MTYSVSNNAKKAMKTITNMQRRSNTMRYNDALLRSFEVTTKTVQDAYTINYSVYVSLLKIWNVISQDFFNIERGIAIIKKYRDTPTNNRTMRIATQLKDRRESLQASYDKGAKVVENIYEQYGKYDRIMDDRDMLIGLYSFEVVQATVLDLIQIIDFTLGSSDTPPYSTYERYEFGNNENNAMLMSGFRYVKGMRAAIKNFIMSGVGNPLNYMDGDIRKADEIKLYIYNERSVLNISSRMWARVHDSSKVINETITLINRVNRSSDNGLDSLRGVAEEQMESLKDQAVAIDRLRMGTARAFEANGTTRVQAPSSPDATLAREEALWKVEQLLVAVGRELVDTFALNAEPI